VHGAVAFAAEVFYYKVLNKVRGFHRGNIEKCRGAINRAPTFFYIYSKQEDFNMKIGKYLLAAATALFLFACSDDSGNGYDGETIVCFGNSLTEGYGAGNPIDKNKSYPHYLSQKVNVPVVNLGVKGETAKDAVRRVNDVLSHNPAVVFIEFGANELIDLVGLYYFRDIDINPNFVAEAEQNFEIILDRLADGNRKIYLVKFYNEKVARDLIIDYLGEDYMWIYYGYETMFANLERKYNDVSLIESMWNEVWGHSELMYNDPIQPIHANAEGYKIIADNIFNEAREYLASKGFVK
jgi:acyl-CoA thioesterase-1